MDIKSIGVHSVTGAQEDEMLRVYENSAFSISFERVFTVTANKGIVRGRHAHKECTQILSCVSGGIDLIVDDGAVKEIIQLTTNSDAILIPPGIWVEQKYNQDKSVLLVLCDKPFDEDDYLRDYEEFLQWKRIN